MPIDADVAAYARHSRWSEPGRFRRQVAALPADANVLPQLLEGWVVHPLAAPVMGIAVPQTAWSDRILRSVPHLLHRLSVRDPRPLASSRPPKERLFCTCRDFALLAAAILREHGIPARLRVGFAGYFKPEFWEDHWVCEYHDGSAWRLLDAELGPATRKMLALDFPPDDVPRERFLAAGPLWQALREGRIDPAQAGVSAIGIGGLWFAGASLLRDAAALLGEEMLPWDYWGPARDLAPDRPPDASLLETFDALATALAGEPQTMAQAQAISERFPWVVPPAKVLSYPGDEPVEIDLARALA